MAQSPDEKTYVGIPFVEQLKGGWNHIEGDIDALYLTERDRFPVERGHSDRFWSLVARVMPDDEEHVRWLNENGADLDL